MGTWREQHRFSRNFCRQAYPSQGVLVLGKPSHFWSSLLGNWLGRWDSPIGLQGSVLLATVIFGVSISFTLLAADWFIGCCCIGESG
jgi:hypothetical protein